MHTSTTMDERHCCKQGAANSCYLFSRATLICCSYLRPSIQRTSLRRVTVRCRSLILALAKQFHRQILRRHRKEYMVSEKCTETKIELVTISALGFFSFLCCLCKLSVPTSARRASTQRSATSWEQASRAFHTCWPSLLPACGRTPKGPNCFAMGSIISYSATSISPSSSSEKPFQAVSLPVFVTCMRGVQCRLVPMPISLTDRPVGGLGENA